MKERISEPAKIKLLFSSLPPPPQIETCSKKMVEKTQSAEELWSQDLQSLTHLEILINFATLQYI